MELVGFHFGIIGEKVHSRVAVLIARPAAEPGAGFAARFVAGSVAGAGVGVGGGTSRLFSFQTLSLSAAVASSTHS
ncbi:hypothetical protein Tco_0405372 [Tanacetum coccineum]